MRIVFLGTPEFAVKPLLAILNCKDIEVIAVVCNKDKPVGRKHILTAPPVKVVALEHNIPIYQYDKIRIEGVADMKSLSPDLMITCAFGQILSQEILDIPKLGVINIHSSLLPKYRGASPINYAILNGESETGITIMKTEIGIDTGDIILQKSLKIEENENVSELFERLSVLGAEAITEALSKFNDGTVIYTPQDETLATTTKMVKKEDGEITFLESPTKTVNRIRAFYPNAYTILNGEPFKIYSAKVYAEETDEKGKDGIVIKSDGELLVGSGGGIVSLTVVQRAGGKPMQISDFLRGNKLKVGEKLGK